MKITIVANKATDKQILEGVTQLTPEMTCAVAARYSRNAGGIDKILDLVKGMDQDKAVDSIFNMVDYGHASIADMADISIFMDGISIYLAYYLFSLSPTGAGQETSTRYVEFNKHGCISAELAGVLPEHEKDWNEFLDTSFSLYKKMTEVWTKIATDHPEVMNLPENVSEKQIERFKRNFVFDRSRYFIPQAAKTNMMLKLSAKEWVRLVRILSSHYLPECKQLASLISPQLELVIPRLMKHSTFSEEWNKYLLDEADIAIDQIINEDPQDIEDITSCTILSKEPLSINCFDFSYHSTRYSPVSSYIQSTFVEYTIPHLSMAELRDLNRHRTGYKLCYMFPTGFYSAEDELNRICKEYNTWNDTLEDEHGILMDTVVLKTHTDVSKEHKLMNSMYWGLLGTTYHYKHGTTLDKLIYEIELRTGLGAHYKYREHMLDVYKSLIEQAPVLEGLILIGKGEPE